MHSLQVFGKIKMSRKVFFANYLVVVVKNFLKVEEVDSEEKLISYYVVIHQQLRVSYYSMFIKLHQEVFTPQVKEVLL